MSRPRKGQEKMPPSRELRELVREHGSFSAVARLFSLSKSSVAEECRRLGIRSPDRRGGRRVCAMCGTQSSDTTVQRFQLHCGARGGHHAGSLDLCEQCWKYARNRAPRRRPIRSSAVRAA